MININRKTLVKIVIYIDDKIGIIPTDGLKKYSPLYKIIVMYNRFTLELTRKFIFGTNINWKFIYGFWKCKNERDVLELNGFYHDEKLGGEVIK